VEYNYPAIVQFIIHNFNRKVWIKTISFAAEVEKLIGRQAAGLKNIFPQTLIKKTSLTAEAKMPAKKPSALWLGVCA
jgi:hypothetical protein